MRKKIDRLSLIIFLASLDLFAFAAWKLISIYTEYQQGTKVYEELQDYVQEPEENGDVSNNDNPEAKTKDSGNAYLQVDFEGLKSVNPDVIAWIQIPALDIVIR